jgi:hypothetical protein
MAIELQDGCVGVAHDGEKFGPMKYYEQSRCGYPYRDEHGNMWTESGLGLGFTKSLVRIIPGPDTQPADPIAHLFEDVPAVPASRRFVGGEIYSCVHLTKERLSDGVNVVVGNEFGHKIYATTSEARLLIAALQAAIEATTPEEK